MHSQLSRVLVTYLKQVKQCQAYTEVKNALNGNILLSKEKNK